MLEFSKVFGIGSYQTSEKLHINLTGTSPEGILIRLLENARCNGQIGNLAANGEPLEYSNRKINTLAVLYTMNQLVGNGKKVHIYRVYCINQLANEFLDINEL